MKKSSKSKTNTSVFDERLSKLRSLLRQFDRAAELPRSPSTSKHKDYPFICESVRFAHFKPHLERIVSESDDFVTLQAEPNISERKAKNIALRKGVKGACRLVESDFFVVWFRVDLYSVKESQLPLALAWDLERGVPVPAFFDILLGNEVVKAQWSPYLLSKKVEEQISELLQLSQDKAIERAEAGLCEVRAEMATVRQRRRELLDEYYQVVEQECEEERKSIYFHLYYFEQEEKLKRRVDEAKNRLEKLQKEEEQMFGTKAQIEMTGAGLFRLPIYRFSTTAGDLDVEAIAGSVLSGN